MYSDLLDRLNELRKRTARFRRVTLHLHSPDSHDWPNENGDATKNERGQFLDENGEALFINELKPQFDLVAVTDHMKCGYGCRLSEVTSPNDDCVVLPGMEVNFKPDAALGCLRIHLVVILPETSTPENFARILPTTICSDAQRTGQEEVEGMTLKGFVEKVHEEQGVCIAAHVDNGQGGTEEVSADCR